MRPLNGRKPGIFGRGPPQPSSPLPLAVPGPTSIRLLSNKTKTVPAIVYKFNGRFYGKIEQPNGSFKSNIFYKVKPLQGGNAPVFEFIPSNAFEYKLNRGNTANPNRVTSISKLNTNPFGGAGNAQVLANFNQWWETVKQQPTNNQAAQFIEFMGTIKKPLPVRKPGETNSIWANRQAANKASINRLVRITSVTPNIDKSSNLSGKASFWNKVTQELRKKPKNFIAPRWNKFLSLGGDVLPGENINNRPVYNKFSSWYIGLNSGLNTQQRANLFNKISRLPNKGVRSNANYVTNANVINRLPQRTGEPNAAYIRRVASAYKIRNIGTVTREMNTVQNISTNKAQSKARDAFWTAVEGFITARAAAAAAAAGAAGAGA